MMPTRALGDLQVSALGMGAMTLTQTPDKDPAQGIQTVHAALDAGVTLFDTADSYGHTGEMGVNELALIRALRARPDALEDVVIATKGGHTRGPNATWWVDGSPEHIARAARDSLQRLGLEALPLYQHHRPDIRVPYADSLGALRQLVDDGIAVRIGVSNIDETQLDAATEIVGDRLVSVQNEYSPLERTNEVMLRLCEKRGIAFLAWGPLGGMRAAKGLGTAAPAFQRVAKRRDVSAQQIALAWLLSLSPRIIPLPGASRAQSVRSSVAAATIELDEGERAELALEASPAEGEIR